MDWYACDGASRANCPLRSFDTLYFRVWIHFAPDHRYIHHFLSISGSQPDDFWFHGSAGCMPNGSLEIFNLAGPVIIAGAPGDTIVVTAVKRARASEDIDAKAHLAAIDIDTVDTGGRVEVRTVVRGRVKHLRTWVDYSVTVPYGTAVSARALDMFVAIYGSEAGNLALRCMATGGIFLGGGGYPRTGEHPNYRQHDGQSSLHVLSWSLGPSGYPTNHLRNRRKCR